MTPDFAGPPADQRLVVVPPLGLRRQPLLAPDVPAPARGPSRRGRARRRVPDARPTTGRARTASRTPRTSASPTTGLHAPDARVQSSSDWAVTARLDRRERARSTRRSVTGSRSSTRGRAAATRGSIHRSRRRRASWSEHGEVLGVTVHGPRLRPLRATGATWKSRRRRARLRPRAARGSSPSRSLPDHTPETLELFRAHAYAFVTDTRVTWSLDAAAPRSSRRTSKSTTDARRAGPAIASTSRSSRSTRTSGRRRTRALQPASYVSPRGPMKLLAAAVFDVERAFHGVLPTLPDRRAKSASDDPRATCATRRARATSSRRARRQEGHVLGGQVARARLDAGLDRARPRRRRDRHAPRRTRSRASSTTGSTASRPSASTTTRSGRPSSGSRPATSRTRS